MDAQAGVMSAGNKPHSFQIGLPPEHFARAFPFHVAVDRNLQVLQAGSTLSHICLDVFAGAQLDDILRPIQPEGDRITTGWIVEHEARFFLLEHRGTGLRLRGEFVILPDDDVILFLGSPWFLDASEIAKHGLRFEDFAIHDPVVDMLQVFQASKQALADAKKLALKLTKQRADLRSANERLSQQEAETRKLALIAARTDNAVVLTDSEGHTIWVNEGFSRLTGYSLQEMQGRKPGSVLQGPGTDPDTIRRIGERLRRGEGFREEILNYGKDGRSYWLAIEVQPIRNEQGHITNFMAIESDITERKQAADELLAAKKAAEEADHAKSELLAAVSHELRTPLTSIRGFLQTLLSVPDMPPDAREEFLKITHDQSLRLSRLVEDLLDLSSLESGRTRFHDELLDLRQIAGAAVAEIVPLAEGKSLRLESDLALALPSFSADAVRIQSIFTNLLGNAVKFTPSGGTVRLELGRHGDDVVIVVRDTGPGIPLDQREMIFEKFHRVYRSHTSVAGTGLGLPIVKAIVDHYRGRIELESEEDRGSCFRVFLPIVRRSDDGVR